MIYFYRKPYEFEQYYFSFTQMREKCLVFALSIFAHSIQ